MSEDIKNDTFPTWVEFPEFGDNSAYAFDYSNLEWTLFDNPSEIDEQALAWINENVHDYVNNEDYEIAVGKNYCEALFEKIKEFGVVTEIKFDGIQKGGINADITVNVDKLTADFKSCEWSEEYIKERYTSYDGFSSSYSSSLTEWLEEWQDFSAHSVGSIMNCLYFFENYNTANSDSISVVVNTDLTGDLHEYVSESVYQGEFIDYDRLVEDFNEEFGTDIDDISELAGVDLDTLIDPEYVKPYKFHAEFDFDKVALL